MKIIVVESALLLCGLAPAVGTDVAGVATSVADAVSVCEGSGADVVLLGEQTALSTGQTPAQVLEVLTAAAPNADVVILAHSLSASCQARWQEAGARAYVCYSSSPDRIWEVCSRAHQGIPTFDVLFPLSGSPSRGASLMSKVPVVTSREAQLLRLMRSGVTSTTELAQELRVSTSTVKTRFESLYTKFEVHDRASLLARVWLWKTLDDVTT